MFETYYLNHRYILKFLTFYFSNYAMFCLEHFRFTLTCVYSIKINAIIFFYLIPVHENDNTLFLGNILGLL